MSEEKKNFYISSNKEKAEGVAKFSEAMGETEHTVAGFYTNVEDNISVRPPFSRKHYERFRPHESVPEDSADIMTACRDAYEKVGLIRSVVDLMSEMAIEGLTLVSENDSTEKFFNAWAKRVDLTGCAEKYASYLIVEGNVAVRSKTTAIDDPEIRRMKRSKGQVNDLHNIPSEYIFYDPASLDLIGGELAIFSGIKKWGIKVAGAELASLEKLVSQGNDQLIKSLPKEIKDALKSAPKNKSFNYNNEVVIPIDEDRLYVDHYKKRDSEIWAKSFIYSILHDVIYNEKLRMAKISALDSWYNAVRVWKLGDHKEEILPDVGSINKLANILENHSGGTMDIIWDSMINFEQHFPPVEKLSSFDENYESILLGLGIHKSLIGGNDVSSAASGAFAGLKNVMKRIDAVRRSITKWIEHEINTISDELGFKNKPKIKFKIDDLFEQGAFFRLLLDLSDRSIISNRTVVEKIGEYYDVETNRINSERIARDAGDLPPLFTPFIQSYIPEENHKKQKDLSGFAPSPQPEQTTEILRDVEQGPSEDKGPTGKRNGRPAGSPDTVKRTRRFKSMAEALIVAERIQDKLDAMCDKKFLSEKGIKNKRMLTSAQKHELEDIKLGLMSIASDDKFSSVSDISGEIDEQFVEIYTEMAKAAALDLNSSELRSLRSAAYAKVNS